MTKKVRVPISILSICLVIFICWFVSPKPKKKPPQFSVTLLDPPKGIPLIPVHMNDLGSILLTSPTHDGKPAFLWSEGEFTEICPGYTEVRLVDLNNRNEVVGTFSDDVTVNPKKNHRPFYWTPESGAMEIELPEGSVLLDRFHILSPIAINNFGRILISRQDNPRSVTGKQIAMLDVGPSFVVSVSPTVIHESFPVAVRCVDLHDEGWVFFQDVSGGGVSNGRFVDRLVGITESDLSVSLHSLNNKGTLLTMEGTLRRQPRIGFGVVYNPVLWDPFGGKRKIPTLPTSRPNVAYQSCHRLAINDRDEVIFNQKIAYDPTWFGEKLIRVGIPLTRVPRFLKVQVGGDWETIPVLFRNGRSEKINDLIAEDLDWVSPGLVDINNRGEMVGVARVKGKTRVVVLKPILQSNP